MKVSVKRVLERVRGKSVERLRRKGGSCTVPYKYITGDRMGNRNKE
jgi:hypothetical protein